MKISKRITLYSTALFLTIIAVSSHAAVIYDWSFQDVDQGGTNTISGTLTLPDVCLTNCTAVSATSVILNEAPFGPLGYDFVLASTQNYNAFIVIDGNITFAGFDAFDDLGSMFELILSFAGYFGIQALGDFDVRATDGLTNGDGTSLVFTRQVSEVPGPGAFGLLLFGLSTICGFRRSV